MTKENLGSSINQNKQPEDGKPMKIIDAHVHCWLTLCGIREGKYITKGEKYGFVRRIGDKVERWLPPSFVNCVVEPEMVLEYMKWVGVERAVLLQTPCYGKNNEYMSEVVQKYPDRFSSLSLVDPRDGDKALEELEFSVTKLGLRGMKFEPPDTPFFLDDPQHLPLWERIRDLDIPVVIDLGWIESEYAYQIDRLRTIVKRYPSLKVLVAHLGISRLHDQSQVYPFPTLQKTLTLLEDSQNIWFEISALQNFCPDQEYPFPRAQEIIKAAYEKVGAERLIWGTDFPTILEKCTYRQALSLVKDECDFLNDNEKSLILGKNASTFFNIPL
jgi:predicted TIM-barrel fold metal-dependent hydrolase